MNHAPSFLLMMVLLCRLASHTGNQIIYLRIVTMKVRFSRSPGESSYRCAVSFQVGVLRARADMGTRFERV
jgi:hypothetical protein